MSTLTLRRLFLLLATMITRALSFHVPSCSFHEHRLMLCDNKSPLFRHTVNSCSILESPSRLPSISSKLVVLTAEKYGKGAEICPSINERSFRLEDSFPNGILPPMAVAALSRSSSTVAAALSYDTNSSNNDKQNEIKRSAVRRKINALRTAMQRVFKRTEEDEEVNLTSSQPTFLESGVSDPIGVSPALIATSLLVLGMMRNVTELLFVLFFSGYLIVLGFLGNSSSRRSRIINDDGAENKFGGERKQIALPALPPQGHLPFLVVNPLGSVLTNSTMYRIWIQTGAILGVFLPLGTIFFYLMGGGGGSGVKNLAAARACSRPLFLLCCQAMSEAISRRVLASLPIRILIPVAYNFIRLAPLWGWALAPIPLGSFGRVLAIASYIYWGANLFGFLIPTAVMRYLSAHFYCVEATEVTLREGAESYLGLLSR